MRRRTGSCGGMTGRGPSGPTRICWSIICGGWSGSALGWETVTLRDLERYMGIVGAELAMPLGRAVAGRQASLRQGGVVDGGGLLERLLPASGLARGEQ